METLVTGATGLVGNDLVHLLVERGHRVRALVRDVARARPHLPEEALLVRGDVCDAASIREAMQGVGWVFHVAGVADQWVPDPSLFERVNTGGTRNMVEAALREGVERFVHTSSMSVFSSPAGGTLTERCPYDRRKPTAYERSKQGAEREVEAGVERGLQAVILNPGALYGPSPFPNSLNGYLRALYDRKVERASPGGVSVLFTRGSTEAHLAAAERGRVGERYLLADSHHSMQEIAEVAYRLLGSEREIRVMSKRLLHLIALISEATSKPLGRRPLVTREQLSYTRWDVRIDASKAQRELGFVPTSLEQGLRRTFASFTHASTDATTPLAAG